MTPNYEDRPMVPPKKSGLPGWAWALIGCGVGVPLLSVPILAAILFPVFAQARDKAQQISCLSNLRQQGVAMQMYIQDNDGRLTPENSRWMNLLGNYVRKTDVFTCPGAKSGGSPDDFPGYAMFPGLSGQKYTFIKDPEAAPLIFDTSVRGRNAYADPETQATFRHGNRVCNSVYLDGHAKAIKRR